MNDTAADKARALNVALRAVGPILMPPARGVLINGRPLS